MDSSSSLSLSLATPSEQFESLKKAARKYESQAYTALTEYGRLAQQTAAASHSAIQQQQHSSSPFASSSSSSYSSASPATSDSSSLLVSSPPASAQSAASLFASLPSPVELERDIGDLLAKLAATTEEMSRSLSAELSGSGGGGASETNAYTVQRYRAILHDYNSEFRKTREVITSARQRAELLLASASSLGSSSGSSSASSLRPRTEQLLREKGSLHNSLRVTDELLSTAAASHSNLMQQSSTLFHTIRGKVSGLRARHPAVSSLIGRIERQRRKDVIVMASVIAACICFTTLYISNKPA